MDKSYHSLKGRNCIRMFKGIKILQASKNTFLKEALEKLDYQRSLENGFCIICNVQTSKLCSNCGAHYCSESCQKKDWEKHRLVCKNKLLMNQRSSSSTSESSANDSDFEGLSSATENNRKPSSKNKSCSQNRETMSTANDFRHAKFGFRTKIVTNNNGSMNMGKSFQQSKIKKDDIKHKTMEKRITSKTNDYDSRDSTNKDNGEETYFKSASTEEENFESKFSFQNEENSSRIKFSVEEELEKLKIFSTKLNHLTVGEIVKVRFIYNELKEKESSLYWIIKDQNISKFEKIQKFLFMEYENLEDTFPQKSGVYGCTYDNKWYRGKVIATQPSLQIFNIDIGTICNPCSKKVKILPPDLEALNGLAFPVELLKSNENSANELECFCDHTIELVGINSKGIYQAKLYKNEHQNYVTEGNDIKAEIENISIVNEIKQEAKDIQQKFVHERGRGEIGSVINSLKEGYTGVFHLIKYTDNELYGCLVPEDLDDTITYHKKLASLCEDNMRRIEANIGDLVIVLKEDNQAQRGRVSSVSNEGSYKIYLIDYGYTIETCKIFELPQNVSSSVRLACKMTFLNSNVLNKAEFLKLNFAYFFEIRDKTEEGKWLCNLKCEPEDIYFAKMLLEENEETPTNYVKSHVENYIPLESECKVIISALGDGNSVYIRRIDGPWETDLEKMVINLNLETKNHEICEDNLSSLQVGDFICAKFQADEIFYRAKILSITSNKVIVVFVDYGNVQETSINDLKPLAKEFLNKPIFAHKVALYNAKSKIISESGYKYLNDIIMNSRELIMTFHDNSSDSVILSERESLFAINEFIFEEEIKIKLEKGNICSEVSIDDFKLSVFSLGEKNLIILHVDEEEFMKNGLFWASDPDHPDFEYIMGKLPMEISDYSFSAASYIPKVGELCLARYEGDWYRGQVINRRGRKFEIFFIDFGNTCIIEPDLIRKEKSEFFEKAPAIVKCIFNEFESLDNNNREAAITFVQKYTNECLNSVVVKKVVDDSCWIHFPSFETEENFH